MPHKPVAALSLPAALGTRLYPPAYRSVVAGRSKRRLAAHFDLQNFGVNLTTLAPGAASALLHSHSKQDEMIYVTDGTLIARVGDEEYPLTAGDCLGFRAGTGVAHQLVNRGDAPASYLEIGDRTPGDEAVFPEDDLRAVQDKTGAWRMQHKDGRPW